MNIAPVIVELMRCYHFFPFLLCSFPTPATSLIGKKLGFTIDSGKFHNISLGQGQEMVAEEALEEAATHGHWVILQVSVKQHNRWYWCTQLGEWLCLLVKWLQGKDCPTRNNFLWNSKTPQTEHFVLFFFCLCKRQGKCSHVLCVYGIMPLPSHLQALPLYSQWGQER